MAQTESAMIEVVAAIIEDGGQYLACRRRIERDAGGLWEFPGGKLEPGETAEDALAREVREELGVEARSIGHFVTVDKGSLRLIFLRARLEGARPTASTDHDRLEWLALGGLSTLAWAQADQVAVEHLVKAG